MEEFAPLAPPVVKMYTCGPTVYDYAHIGNFRAYVFEDILRRYLKFCGFQVKQVMNLTDVDDKTIKGAQLAGAPLSEYTQRYKDAFFADISALNIEPAEHYPAATGHVSEMIALISALIKKGYAYLAADGSIYFSIARFGKYGQLARLDMAGLKPGARVAQDEYEKENVSDFALWKARQEEDGAVWWDSPWGKGRPGWHIECSTMSMKYLGESFDLHTGGIDNIFPHHEDEIAQSEAATGRQFVKYWMHCAHLVVDGRKMSKSLGNFYTLRDLIQKGYSGREIRYVLISAHYRQSLNFTFPALDAARSSLQRLDEFSERLAGARNENSCRAVACGVPSSAAVARPGRSDGLWQAEPLHSDSATKVVISPVWLDKCLKDFYAAMDDDLNLPLALAALFDLVREGNKKMDLGPLPAAEAASALKALEVMDRVLGILKSPADQPPEEMVNLARMRQDARRAKNWTEADRLRKEIEAKGWLVQDAAEGFKLKRMATAHVQGSIVHGSQLSREEKKAGQP